MLLFYRDYRIPTFKSMRYIEQFTKYMYTFIILYAHVSITGA